MPLITSKSARRLIRECLSLRGHIIPVLAYDEIPPGIKLEASYQINIDEVDEEEILEAAA